MSMPAVIALFFTYKYPALTALAIFEGPYLMMMSGLLIKLGILSLIPTYIALSVGDLIGDIAWYYVGYFFGDRFAHRFGKIFDISAESIENVKELFLKHRKKILLGSKVTAGFGLSISTLVTAGMVRAPFGEFVFLNFFGQLAWTGIMIAIGYFFGNLYVAVDDIGGRIAIVAAALLAIYLTLRLSRRLGQRAKERLTNKE